MADFWDAITLDRLYRKAMVIMLEERGKTFDPALFDLFTDGRDKLYMKYIDTETVDVMKAQAVGA